MANNHIKLRDNLEQAVLLDTNVLQYIGVYLDYAEESGKVLFPFCEESSENSADIDNSIDRLKNPELTNVDGGFREGLLNGLLAIKFLQDTKSSAYYSTISEIELLKGRVTGHVKAKLAKESIPNRMWSRLGERVYRDRISSDELITIKDGIVHLMEMVQKVGINLVGINRELEGDILDFAKDISGFIYMDVLDSIIYASAFGIEADYIMTYDGYLKETINYISYPGSDNKLNDEEKELYRAVRGNIRAKFHEKFIREIPEVNMPLAISMKTNGKPSPSIENMRS